MSSSTMGNNKVIGFLSLYETISKDGYLGAILITDMYGIPQEFRCTHPVKPTMIQKPLYGDKLEPYIGISLCGVPLIQSLQNKPAVMIVQKEYLLEVRKDIDIPVIFIRKAGEAIDIKYNETIDNSSVRRERMDSPTGSFQPLIISTFYGFQDDVTEIRAVIEEAFKNFDLIEPFERIEKSIEVLSKQHNRFQ